VEKQTNTKLIAVAFFRRLTKKAVANKMKISKIRDYLNRKMMKVEKQTLRDEKNRAIN
jgi:hypothetical protein